MTALSELELDMSAFQAAQSYWSARMQENPELGMKLAQLMSRFL